VSTAFQADPELLRARTPASAGRVTADGKFLRAGEDRFLIKGVTYGTFAPDTNGYQFPSDKQVAEDFRLMAAFGFNTVRTYTPPSRKLLDEAAANGLHVMVGLPWSQHVAFLG
jgi:O-antigen biosynthesis protein